MLQGADWIFWLDDDAGFLSRIVDSKRLCLNFWTTQYVRYSVRVLSILGGGETFISLGNFFVRNSDNEKELIRLAKATNLDEVEAR